MLAIKNLCIEKKDGAIVRDLSLAIAPGEISGIVGESGSGKTMTALAVMGLLPDGLRVTGGEILFDGQDLLQADEKKMRGFRGNAISMIFQEPMTSLNPVMRIGRQVEESLLLHSDFTGEILREKALEILREVELDEPEAVYQKYPHQLSGGMRQRVMIASALICRPRLLIADEPTTALDVTIQSQILKLLKRLHDRDGMAILLISHDLHVVRRLCSTVSIMQGGVLVESGPMEEVFQHPVQPYTRRLLDAIPDRKHSLRREQRGMQACV